MNLENLNLVELNAQEVREVDGGIWAQVFVGVVLTGIITDWAGFKSGFGSGFSSAI